MSAKSDTVFTDKVSGAKELKKYIQTVYDLAVRVSYEFNQDLKQNKAVVERVWICRGKYDFSVEMCVIAHNDLVNQLTQLPQSSEFLNTAGAVLTSINQLESIRKMLVNNKQQKKTAIRRIRQTIKTERESSSQHQSVPEEDDDDIMMVELEQPASKLRQELYGLIEMTKQHHRTVSKQLLQQAQLIMRALRFRFRAFKLAAENTIGQIIHHAEKCRAFIMRCRWLALLEYCASSWWHETQIDPMDRSTYSISAVIVGEENDYKMFNSQKSYTAFTEELMKAPIRIVVTGSHPSIDDERHRAESSISYDLCEELAATILTEDAINAFENEQNDLWIQQYQEPEEESQQ